MDCACWVKFAPLEGTPFSCKSEGDDLGWCIVWSQHVEIISPALEPQSSVKSTKRAVIVGSCPGVVLQADHFDATKSKA